MKKKMFRERQEVAQKIFDMKYDEVINAAKEIKLEKEIEHLIDVAEKPRRRGRRRSVK